MYSKNLEKPTIEILRGLPASGKSSYAIERVKSGKGRVKRVNKDLMREMVDCNSHSGERERTILDCRDALIEDFIDKGFDVIVDDTNLADKHINRIYNKFIHKAKVKINRDFMNVPLEVCLMRDAARQNSVGAKVIQRMYHQFILPPIGSTYDEKASMPKAFIVDVDGTVADMTNIRHPYEWQSVNKDRPITTVISTIKMLSKDAEILFLSGRDGSCEKLTRQWLEQYVALEDYKLFMRKAGDDRKDSIVKKEIYEDNIKGNFNIVAVFDDRDQVVNMWRREGLTCFQVNYGNF
jgi:predicted kinase